MNIESFRELVKSLDKFLPFSPGEDPVLWAQVNTVKRIQEYLQKVIDTENLNLDDRKTEVECDHHWHWEVGGNSCCVCNQFERGEKL